MLSDPVLAASDLWFIGDAFLNEIYHTLSYLKTEANAARNTKRQMPYMYDYYNIKCFTPNPSSVLKNVMARIVNCFIKALNDHNKLPRLVIIIPDVDILKQINHFGFGVKLLLHEAIDWILNQMQRAVEAKIDILRNKRPGAVVVNEPKFIWVKAINRLNGYSKVLALRRKFNETLEGHLAGKMNHYILDVNDKLADCNFCDQNNKLNGFGRERFWMKVDRGIELFDKRKINLRPRVHTDKSFNTQEDGGSRERRQDERTNDECRMKKRN